VQVSLDGGKTWQGAETKAPLSKWAWVLWRYDWKPTSKGKYKIMVRGIDKAGKVQESGSIFSRSLSEGEKGYHTVKVKVV
jgi:hypothetical protein